MTRPATPTQQIDSPLPSSAAFFIGLLVWFGASGDVHAQVALELTELRSAELPVEVAGARFASTADGRTIVANTTGSPENAACTVVVVDDGAATSYRYENGPRGCVGILPHPAGGFFLRTRDPTADPQASPRPVTGETARIGADGEVLWSIPDRELVDALPEAERGTGEFLGQYGGPVGSMAYSETFDKLLAFTTGELSIGAGAKIVQAHVVDGADGQLRESGQTFGEDTGGSLAALTTRASDGYFVLAIYRSGTDGVNLYTYNGRRTIDFLRPGGQSWDQRDVRRVAYDAQGNLYLLWVDGEPATSSAHLSAAGPEGQLLWSQEYPSVLADGADLGQPRGFWVGARYGVILYVTDTALQLRVVDILDGSEIGVAALQPPSGYQPITVLTGVEQRLKLLAFDPATRRLIEYEIGVSQGLEDDEEPQSPGASGASQSDDGCGCSSTRGAGSPAGGILLVVVGLYAVRSRRRWVSEKPRFDVTSS